MGSGVGREHLDTMLIDRARTAGAQVFQPVGVRRLNRIEDGYCCILDGREESFVSHIVIAGHGYWEPGSLPTQPTPSQLGPMICSVSKRISRVPISLPI